ncbi:hypothetical protein KUTeg_002546 [Tegillarca granosa]|uniref:Uncharacterized protein n=1 Tax=Tegillarca granosa TaxID=220873 RepID=A0ABQ9FUL6_TEGGR|nr:hypothetical protein KUTeg_002546 [Tegillarca granosa]
MWRNAASSGFESSVWMKNLSLNEPNSDDICYTYYPRISQTKINLLQSSRSCQERAPVLCEVDKRHPTHSVPQVEISYNRAIGNNKAPFASIPLICNISRDLTKNETLVYEKDGEAVNSFNYEQSQSNNRSFKYDVPEYIEREGEGDPFYIPNYMSRTAFRYVGRYTCRVYSNNSKEVYSSKAISIRIDESLLIIYRASLKLQFGPTQKAFTIYNLYSDVSAGETTPVTSGLTNTFSLMESKLPQSVLALQYFSRFHFTVDRIKFSGPGGTLVTFNVIGRPTNASWYSIENEQLLKEEITRLFLPSLLESQEQPLKRSISNLQTVYVRGSFNLQSTVACSGQVYNLDYEYLLDFKNTGIGEYSVTKELCITDKRPLATAFCAGNGFTGAVLTNITINPLCRFKDISGTQVTPTLKNLSEIVVTSQNVENVTAETVNLTKPSNILTSIDVIYTAEILRNIATDVDNITEKVVQNVIDIVDNILEVDRNTLQESQNRGSATNRILESIEEIGGRVEVVSNKYRSLRNNLALEIWDIVDLDDPVVGIKLNSNGSINLQNNSVVTLRDKSDYDPGEVDAAIVLPESIYTKYNGSKRLVLQVYSSSKLFNTRKENQRYSAQSRIVAAKLVMDGQTVHQFETKFVTTVFKPINVTLQDVDKLSCGYWNYTIYDTSGGWATDGCSLDQIKSGRYICVCNHLTNFAILLDFEGTPLPPEHKTALTIITIIGLSLSIAGLLFTVLTFIWFRQLRKGRSQQTLFNLALAMLCSWIVFLAGVERTESYAGCIVVAALLHYFILVSFMWMLIEGILQYLRFVKVLGTYIPRFIFKAVLPAWGIPLLPVIIILAIDRHLYWGGNGYCWMSLTAFYYSFAIPVGLVILANIIVFIIVLYNILNRPKIQSNQSERKIAIMNFRAALSVFVLLGLTWIFGYFAIADARLVFQYIFTILNVFQGLFIFILFTAREKQVRQQWARCCCKKSTKSKYSADKTNSSGSNQPLKNSKTGTTDTHSSSLMDYNGTKKL